MEDGNKTNNREPGTKEIEIARSEIESIAEKKALEVVGEKLKDGIPSEQLSGIVDEASKKVLIELEPEVMRGMSAMNSRLGQLAENQEHSIEAVMSIVEGRGDVLTIENCPECGYKHLTKKEGEAQPPAETPPPETPPSETAPPTETPPAVEGVSEAVEEIAQETAETPPPTETPDTDTPQYVGKCPQCNAYFDQNDKNQGFSTCPVCGTKIQWA